MPRRLDHLEQIDPRTRAQWRAWLARNHTRRDSVWLVYYKKHTGKGGIVYDEAVEEALCFGWIDSVPRSLDEERWQQLFSPRKPRSPWSALNKKRIARLTRAGLMKPPGLAKITAAKKDGSWSALDAIERLSVPRDLSTALRSAKGARASWDAFSPSSRKAILWWIASAKTDATRAKRVKETVRLAAKKLRANHPESKGR